MKTLKIKITAELNTETFKYTVVLQYLWGIGSRTPQGYKNPGMLKLLSWPSVSAGLQISRANCNCVIFKEWTLPMASSIS